ncbi:MAG: PAS domain S-box protein, partial [Rhodospirillales bacterium]|nr:PAS domain S-box protein [Rhodospirillales bacterium]
MRKIITSNRVFFAGLTFMLAIGFFLVRNSNLFSNSDINQSSFLAISIAICFSAVWFYFVLLREASAKKILEDHTRELAISASRLDAISSTTTDAIFTVNSDGTITSLNLAGESIFGYQDQEIIGRHITELLPHCILDCPSSYKLEQS